MTLVDFPGKIAAIVFTQGCNFRCGFCHNPELVCPELFQAPIPQEDILTYLGSRKGKLEGVVITGGEPTIQRGLVDFIMKLKALGFAVKLDTNGSQPEVVGSLIELKLIDYIAMDVKTSLSGYFRAAGVSCDTDKIQESIRLIKSGGLPHQFRTTLVKGVCSAEDLKEIQGLIAGTEHYALQPFVCSQKMINPAFARQENYTSREMEEFKTRFEKYPRDLALLP